MVVGVRTLAVVGVHVYEVDVAGTMVEKELAYGHGLHLVPICKFFPTRAMEEGSAYLIVEQNSKDTGWHRHLPQCDLKCPEIINSNVAMLQEVTSIRAGDDLR